MHSLTFVGDVNSKPQLNCVFQSDEAQNEFLSNPKIGLGEDVYDKSKKKGVLGTGFSLDDLPFTAGSADSTAGTVAGDTAGGGTGTGGQQ